MGVRRLKGSIPKVGIRPTTDGREKGVRESLEDQTMRMAKAVADLLSHNLRHPNGMNVECVISDGTIGGVAEAAICAEKFEREKIGLSITVTPCWCYSAEVLDNNSHIPKAIWGFNGTERPGAVFLAAVLAAHSQKGLPAFGIYGKDVQDEDDSSIPEDVKEKLLLFARAGLAVAWMRGRTYLSIGGVSMGIAGSIVDEKHFQDYLGMRNGYVDMSEVTRRLKEDIYDKEEYSRAIKWVRENCREGKDTNPPEMQKSKEQKEKEWETIVKMTMICRDLMVGNLRLKELGFGEESYGHNAIAAGFQGQRQWTDFMPNGDFMETILNSSFDWNGIRQPYIMATENDALNGIAMLFGHLLTQTSQIFADVRTYWSPEAVKRVTGMDLTGKAKNGIIHLINSGSASMDGTGQQESNGQPVLKPFWEITVEEMEKCLASTKWDAVVYEYFRGGGFSSNFLTRGVMPMTMSRVNIIKDLGLVIQLAEGWAINIPEEIHRILDDRTNNTWPTTWFVPRLTGKGAFKSVYNVMNNWGANHGALCFGHIGTEMLTLASMLRIPVSMHNVPAEKVFRPSTWSAFGTRDLEGADFRACKTLGPLYK
ncbi:MAG TPA: L-fucose isomerase [Candidatus Aminicenantes bacterium]|nr:L-fucose isomerase [Candidatus Aminicenantes bacterium]